VHAQNFSTTLPYYDVNQRALNLHETHTLLILHTPAYSPNLL